MKVRFVSSVRERERYRERKRATQMDGQRRKKKMCV